MAALAPHQWDVRTDAGCSTDTVSGAGFLRLRSRLSWLPPLRNDLLLAAAWFVLGTAFYLTGLQKSIFRFRFEVPLWQWLVVLAVGGVAMVLRRPAPLSAVGLAVLVVIVDWFHGPSLPVVPMLSAVLYGVTRYGSPRLSRAMLVAVVVSAAAITVGSAALDGDWRVGLLVILQAGAILLLPVWWAMEVREHHARAEIARRDAAQRDRIAELDQHIASIAERARMAHDLPDGSTGPRCGLPGRGQGLSGGGRGPVGSPIELNE